MIWTARKISARLVILVLGVVVATMSAATAPGAQWDYQLTATNGSGSSQVITVGIDPAGTAGIDAALGEVELPPWPPTSILDVRLAVAGTEGVRREVRSDQPVARTHSIRWQAGAGGYPITLHWDRNAMPLATFTLQDGYTGQFIPPVDMAQVDSLVVPVEMSFIQRLTLTVLPGSVPPAAPVISPTIADISVFEGTAIPEIVLDDFVSDADHSDAVLTWLALGDGPPWLSITPERHLAFDVPPGWNGTSVFTLRVEDPDGLFAEQALAVTVQPDGAPAWSVPLTVENAALVSDGASFGIDPAATAGVDAALGEVALPPWPPTDVLDARFLLPGGLTHVDLDLRQTVGDTINWILEWQSGAGGYPLTVRWPADLPPGSFWLQDGYGGSVIPILDMATATSLTIPASLDVIKRLKISAVPLLSAPPMALTQYYVAPTGSDANPGTAAAPLSTIAHATSLAAVGDTITIVPGGYLETGIVLADGVLIRRLPATGSKTITSVIIDAEYNNDSIFTGNNLSAGVTLEGLTLVRAGSRAVSVDSSSLSLIDCHFEDNAGAVRCTNGELTVQGTDFHDNADWRGGGIYTVKSQIHVDDCVFRFNAASQGGGAIYATASGNNEILNSEFSSNGAPDDAVGAVWFLADVGPSAAFLQVENCNFDGNEALGGVAIQLGRYTSSVDPSYEARIVDCLFTQNRGAEVLRSSSYNSQINSSTFSANTAANILYMSNSLGSASVYACIIAENAAQAVGGSLDSFTSCNVFANDYGNYVGPVAGMNDVITNFSADPVFCDTIGGDYTLAALSPCLAVNSPLQVPVLIGSEGQGCGTASSVGRDLPPSQIELTAAYPNPFNPSTTLGFSLPASRTVSLQIFDLAGRLVRNIIDDDVLPAGVHQRRWNGQDEQGRLVSSGVYLYRLQAGGFVQTRQMLLLK